MVYSGSVRICRLNRNGGNTGVQVSFLYKWRFEPLGAVTAEVPLPAGHRLEEEERRFA
jgi:hypothetical protein